jgi:Tfp pilus assembly protein PilF
MKTLWPVPILLIGLLAACAGIERSPVIDSPSLSFESDSFGESPDIISVPDIYHLSSEQQSAFMLYFDDPLRQSIPAHERLFYYLDDITTSFTYLGETYTASVALEESSGNCLSLAILTTALAQLVNVETGYQLIDSNPVFESHGTVIYKGLHVRTKLYDQSRQSRDGISLFQSSGLLIDYFPSDGDRFVSNISEAQYHAMYYNNLASDAVTEQDYKTAFWLLRKSLELAPDNSGAINTMAVVYKRTGEVAKAEEIYKYGIENLPGKVSLLRNYRILLRQQARYDEVEKINETLARLEDPNPFDWLHAGRDAYNNGEYKDAISFYKKAVEIAPYLHESYAGMARAYFQLGNLSGVERELKNAEKYSNRESTRSMYQAKLVALNSDY